MSVRRRPGRGAADPIEALRRGETPEFSPEAMDRLVDWYFFQPGEAAAGNRACGGATSRRMGQPWVTASR
jgi:hypothetical protein